MYVCILLRSLKHEYFLKMRNWQFKGLITKTKKKKKYQETPIEQDYNNNN